MYPELFALYLYSYLAGAVPTPYLIARVVKGIDLRQYGSGNVGGSNVTRQLGRKWFVPLALIEFILKGLSPVILGIVLLEPTPGLENGLDDTSPWFLLAPLLALAGNNWSVFLRFQGGRGLMVICGILIALVPLLFAAAISIYLAGWRISRSSAVWALIAVGSLPVLALLPGGYLLVDWNGLAATLFDGNASQSPNYPPVVISWFCGGILALVVLKRILSNTLSFPEDLPRKKVLFNRLFLDRDVDDRAEWLERAPTE